MTTQPPRSYYEASAQRPAVSPPLAGEVRADVCIVGGGYTGLSCALELARRGRKVVVLEGATVGWGASGRNGGQFLHGFSTDNLAPVAKMSGVDEKTLFGFSLAAIDMLRERVREHSIHCDLHQGYMLAAVKERQYRQLADYHSRLQSFGCETDLLDAADTRAIIASRRYHGAIYDKNSGHLHPLKYLLGLAQAAKDAGAEIYEHSLAINYKKRDGKLFINTPSGAVVCTQGMLAGNAYQGEFIPPLRARIMPVGSYIGATRPLGEKRARQLIANGASVCDMRFVLDYYRITADWRLLFGGRVSYINLGAETAGLRASLRRRICHVFPQMADEELDYFWGGSVAITASRFPDIGRRGDWYYAQGFSGHGVALSGFCGAMAARAMIGDAEVFDVFSRVRHRRFTGGRFLRAPMLAAAMAYFRLRDLF
ncbi:MAG: NAD(P)/FAD-dependent oxidoreductase [Gammaproteobacteria bacterium]